MPGFPPTGCGGVKWVVEGATESCAGWGDKSVLQEPCHGMGKGGCAVRRGPDFLSPGDSL